MEGEWGGECLGYNRCVGVVRETNYTHTLYTVYLLIIECGSWIAKRPSQLEQAPG